MSSCTVTVSGRAMTVIAPEAVAPVRAAFSVNLRLGAADADGDRAADGVSEGEAVAVPSDSPHAASNIRAVMAAHSLMPAPSTHLCSRCYRCRLLDGCIEPAAIKESGRCTPARL